MDSDESVWQEFVSFFRFRWSTNVGSDDSFILLDSLSHVTDEKNRELIRAVSIEKIRRTLRSMVEDKALGPDSFPSLIFRKDWPIIQTKVAEAMMEFFATGDVDSLDEDLCYLGTKEVECS